MYPIIPYFKIFREWIMRRNCLGQKVVWFWPKLCPNCTVVLKEDFWGKLTNANLVNILFPITQKYFKINSVAFYTCVPKTTFIWGTVPEIQTKTNLFRHFGPLLPFTLIVRRGEQSPTWKDTVPPKEPTFTWSDIT